jgi:hypothetical protein
MSLLSTTWEVSIPEEESHDMVLNTVCRTLSERGMEITTVNDPDLCKRLIRGETSPSLLSWGDQVHVLIGDSNIIVSGRNENQLFAWFRLYFISKSVSETIEDRLQTSADRPRTTKHPPY